MKIRMKTLAMGPGVNLKTGMVYDLPDEQAQALFEAGYADIVPVAGIAVKEEPKVEQAISPGAPETTEGAGNRRRRGKV